MNIGELILEVVPLRIQRLKQYDGFAKVALDIGGSVFYCEALKVIFISFYLFLSNLKLLIKERQLLLNGLVFILLCVFQVQRVNSNNKIPGLILVKVLKRYLYRFRTEIKWLNSYI